MTKSSDDIIRVRLHVTGHVQGVGFRNTSRHRARKLGLRATAENQEDGSVIIEAEGPRGDVNKLIKWVWHGPEFAKVDHVSVIELHPV